MSVADDRSNHQFEASDVSLAVWRTSVKKGGPSVCLMSAAFQQNGTSRGKGLMIPYGNVWIIKATAMYMYRNGDAQCIPSHWLACLQDRKAV